MAAVDSHRPHFILVPFMLPGHMIPMVDMARALVGRGGVTVTLVTTPANLARISPVPHNVTFLSVPFPATTFGLPEECETMDLLPSRHLVTNFLDAARTLREPLSHHLRSTATPRPSCIISDSALGWTLEVARELRIPRLLFHGMGCFALLCVRVIRDHNLLADTHNDDDDDGEEAFALPGIPDRVELTRAQLPGFRPLFVGTHREENRAAEMASDGVVVNSFNEMEPGYWERYEKAVGMKVWTIGPMLSAASEEMSRCWNRSTIDEELCLNWLDSLERSASGGRVIYVSFGSLARTSPEQMVEIGLGLEAVGCPFIWVIKTYAAAAAAEWLGGGFEERVRGRGLIIRGWAPQAMILAHAAVGGFVTHCGWNSTLEAAAAGVPMVTWPQFAEQFVNEKLVVDILGIGVRVGVRRVVPWQEEGAAAVVGRAEVERAVRKVLEGKGIKERAKRMRESSRRAVEEGGSSFENLRDLIANYTKP